MGLRARRKISESIPSLQNSCKFYSKIMRQCCPHATCLLRFSFSFDLSEALFCSLLVLDLIWLEAQRKKGRGVLLCCLGCRCYITSLLCNLPSIVRVWPPVVCVVRWTWTMTQSR